MRTVILERDIEGTFTGMASMAGLRTRHWCGHGWLMHAAAFGERGLASEYRDAAVGTLAIGT